MRKSAIATRIVEKRDWTEYFLQILSHTNTIAHMIETDERGSNYNDFDRYWN